MSEFTPLYRLQREASDAGTRQYAENIIRRLTFRKIEKHSEEIEREYIEQHKHELSPEEAEELLRGVQESP